MFGRLLIGQKGPSEKLIVCCLLTLQTFTTLLFKTKELRCPPHQLSGPFPRLILTSALQRTSRCSTPEQGHSTGQLAPLSAPPSVSSPACPATWRSSSYWEVSSQTFDFLSNTKTLLFDVVLKTKAVIKETVFQKVPWMDLMKIESHSQHFPWQPCSPGTDRCRRWTRQA